MIDDRKLLFSIR